MSLKREKGKSREKRTKGQDPSSNTQDNTTAQLKGIESCIEDQLQRSKGNCIDLSKNALSHVPNQLIKCSTLRYLYLEGNKLESLPENFFEALYNLEWLDLRNNCLKKLPEAIRHRNLKTLLLQGNNLHELPKSLGSVSSLTGLNIAGNPLVYPAQDVIQQGTKAILRFLKTEADHSEGGKQASSKNIGKDHSDSDELSDDDFHDLERNLKGASSAPIRNRFQGEVSQPPNSAPPSSLYGAVLGGNPRSNVIKPWRTGIYFSKLEGSEREVRSSADHF